MKLFLLFSLLFSTLFSPTKIAAKQKNMPQLDIDAPAAILIEESSGNVIYAKNENEKLYPASMTKMMGMLLILEDITNNKHSFDEMVTTSSTAASMGGSQIFLEVGEMMSVDDMFKAVCINSANDAITALAEHFGGSLDSFIKRMNAKAKNLGMNNTSFMNVTGFYDPNHYTTAYDMALLAKELLNNYKDIILKYTSMFEAYIREDSDSTFCLVTTNKLIKYYDGMDGLKTGYIKESKYCLTATAIRDGIRFISVVMKSDSVEKRSKDTTTLLNYGFANYKSIELFKEGELITTHTFKNAKTKNSPIISNQQISIITTKEKSIDDFKITYRCLKHKAPLKAKEKVGELIIEDTDGNTYIYDLLSLNNIEDKNFLYKLIETWKDILS